MARCRMGNFSLPWQEELPSDQPASLVALLLGAALLGGAVALLLLLVLAPELEGLADSATRDAPTQPFNAR